MGTGQRKSALSYIPGYKNNAVIQLIMAIGVAYIMLAITWALIMIVYVGNPASFNEYFVPNIGLGSIDGFKSHIWTIFTYGWFQFPNSFMEVLSNMLWLYCFGSVVQMLVGHKQVIPMYAYSLIVGGIFYMLAQFLPAGLSFVPAAFMGARAGLMGLAVAAVTLTPKYKFYLTETFSIPLAVVVGVFVVLMFLGNKFYFPVIALLMGGGFMGFAYVKLLQAGFKPGEWIYTFMAKVEGLVTPDEKYKRKQFRARNSFSERKYERQQGVPQSRIDEILDKINQKGYNSLSKEEKEMLLKAGE